MATTIFSHQTTNALIDTISGLPIRAQGMLQVDISGTLGGADVMTYYKGAKNALTEVRSCSWKTSEGDVLNTADGGQDDHHIREIAFEIKNAGAETNISLQFDSEILP